MTALAQNRGVFEPIRPVPPMTTIFTVYPPLSMTGGPLTGISVLISLSRPNDCTEQPSAAMSVFLCLVKTPTTAKKLEFGGRLAYRHSNVERCSSHSEIVLFSVS